MDTTIICGLISAAAAIIVCLLNNRSQQAELEKKHTDNIVLINFRLDELKNAVEKHNQLVERTYKLEKDVAIIKEKMEG